MLKVALFNACLDDRLELPHDVQVSHDNNSTILFAISFIAIRKVDVVIIVSKLLIRFSRASSIQH
jgi:hypothetical protein